MKAIIDHDLCIGDGICEDECAEVFRLEDDGLAYVIDDNPAPELYDCMRNAADACPVQAITIEG
jgi:ferredoxin